MSERLLLDRIAGLARDFLDTLPHRPVGARADLPSLRKAFGGVLPSAGADASTVIEHLVAAAEPGLVASAGPRYFGFVIGGSLPAALAADWLAAAWDQDAGLYACGPAAAVVEEVAAAWLLDLLGLPQDASVGFVTGCQMANFTGLAAGRHAVLARAGYEVEEDGLQGAPPVNVVAAPRRPKQPIPPMKKEVVVDAVVAAAVRPCPARPASITFSGTSATPAPRLSPE